MLEKISYFTYNSRVGAVTIAASTQGICALQFGELTVYGAMCAPSALTNAAATQVQEYFAGKRLNFDVPLDVSGSEFAQAVWNQTCKIAYGTTATASEIATCIGKPTSLRKVGSALIEAPVELIIPTHRVVSAQGYTRGSGQLAQQHEKLHTFAVH